jgi:hypothetical protein
VKYRVVAYWGNDRKVYEFATWNYAWHTFKSLTHCVVITPEWTSLEAIA